jgi:hypothetical protein
MDSMPETKDWAVMGLGVSIGFASFAISDPWLFFPCLIIAWGCFIYLATVHSNFQHKIRFCVSGSIIFFIGASRAYFYSEHQAQTAQRDNASQYKLVTEELSKTRKEMHEQFSSLVRDFSVSANIAPSVRIAVLKDQQAKVLQEKTNLIQAASLIPVNDLDLESMRAERENREAIQEKQDRADELQLAMNKIKSDEKAAADKAIQMAQQQNNQEQAEKIASEQNQQYAEIFDYTIQKLDTMLVVLSTETGLGLSSDFPNGVVTIAGGGMESEGKLIAGKHEFKLGMDSNWDFTVSTFEPTWQQKPYDKNYEDLTRRFNSEDWDQSLPFCLNIEAHDKNMSRLKILPVASDSVFRGTNLADHVWVMLLIKNEMRVNEYASITNYQTNIDSALRSFFESQDEQSPLPVKSKTP